MPTATINESSRIWVEKYESNGQELVITHRSTRARVVGYTTLAAAEAAADDLFAGTSLVADINRTAAGFYELTYEADDTSGIFPSSQVVTFDAQGGSTPDPETKVVIYGGVYGTLATTSRDGFTFMGWFTAVSGGGDQIVSSTACLITAAQTLYAYWVAV